MKGSGHTSEILHLLVADPLEAARADDQCQQRG